MLTLIELAHRHGERIAVICDAGSFSYADLLRLSWRVAAALMQARPAGQPGELAEQPVALLTQPDIHYVAAQWGIWRAGGIAVPISTKHPLPEIEYILDDTGATTVIVDDTSMPRLQALADRRGLTLIRCSVGPEGPAPASVPEPAIDEQRRAMILYTSGTTGRPKGVVSSHAHLRAQCQSMQRAWEWSASDRTINVLPLHHTHGIVNVLLTSLRTGAVCELLPGFDADRVWQRLGSGEISVFMAVPTIYARLGARWRGLHQSRQEELGAALRRMRLLVSGSAALPVSLLEEWRALSGHTLLERYGMTEIGMALSSLYRGERLPGRVGYPMPGIRVRLVGEDGAVLAGDEQPGEIQVQGPTVFMEYWRRPEETQASFQDGWFCTGDIAVRDGQGSYRILGRASVDIIKSGGYKLSALEIEEVLRTHPDIAECAVVGLPDTEWGERVAAAIVLVPGAAMTLEDVRAWAKERLAPYKVPTRMVAVAELPRNAMGKVQKPEIARLFA